MLEHTPLESCLYHRHSESFLSSLSQLTDGYDNTLCLGTVCFIICFHILIYNNSQWLTMYIHNDSLCIYTMAHYVYTQWLTMYIHKLHILESEVLYTKLVMTMYLHLLKRAHVLTQELCKECIYLHIYHCLFLVVTHFQLLPFD